jgi:hypothetical protein
LQGLLATDGELDLIIGFQNGAQGINIFGLIINDQHHGFFVIGVGH